MPVTFKSTGLSLGRKVQRLSAEGKAVTREAIRKELLNLVEEGFQARAEPRGREWEPRKKAYPWPILEKTGKARRSFTADASGPNVIVSNSATDRGKEYVFFHQKGWRQGGIKQPARQVMPIAKMPQTWKGRLDRVVALALQALQ
jgi:phage gpG-like protein